MELQLQNLSKQYGTKCAVDNVNVSLTAGVYGLLGANGAGKTTLMRMICGVLKPTSGSICLNGKTIGELGEQYYTHLGYMPQDFGFYPDFTAREFMLYMATVKGLDKKQAKSRTDSLLRMVNLSDVADKKIKSFSGGMKQRLGIAQAELNNPSILSQRLDLTRKNGCVFAISYQTLQKKKSLSYLRISFLMFPILRIRF